MNTIILTHGDCDGICSAALYKSIYPKSKVFFTHPHGIRGDLIDSYRKELEKIVILDIALDESIWYNTVKKLNKLSRKTEITYVDHHPKPKNLESKEIRFNYIWIKDQSTSEITFRYLKNRINRDMSRVALYGAIGDYSDETKFVKEMYNKWDKRLIYFEGGLLSQALEGSRREYGFKRNIVEYLSKNLLPSEDPKILQRGIEMSRIEEK